MNARLKRVVPYGTDALNLPVANVDDAVPYYLRNFRFQVVSRTESPYRAAILERDSVRIGLAENGGDPAREGCYFEVDDIEAAFLEIKGRSPLENDIKPQNVKGASQRVFFDIAPDGLCFMFGQPTA